MAEKPPYEPPRDTNREAEGSVYEKLVALTDGISATAEEPSYSVFVGNGSTEKENKSLFIEAKVGQGNDKKPEITLDLRKLPPDRKLQPHFQINSAAQPKRIESLPIDQITIKTGDAGRREVAFTTKFEDSNVLKEFMLNYILRPDGTLERNMERDQIAVINNRMFPKVQAAGPEIPDILSATLGYLDRTQDTISETREQSTGKFV